MKWFGHWGGCCVVSVAAGGSNGHQNQITCRDREGGENIVSTMTSVGLFAAFVSKLSVALF